MARWRLTNSHYLNVPEREGQRSEWEQRETSQQTGRQVRKLYPVPLLLDPKDPADFNYPGEIIVAHEGSKYPRDLIFIGPPTPDMEPLDEEAEKITEAQRPKWIHPVESLSGNFSDSVLAVFERQLAEVIRNSGGIPKMEVPNSSVPADALAKMQEQINFLMEKNAELERKLVQGDDNGPPEELNVAADAPQPVARRA